MSQIITHAFARYWQDCLLNDTPVVLDECVLAYLPGLDPEAPIDPGSGLPPAAQIVHRQAIDQRGRIHQDTVAYTIVMDTTVGDFEFNALYLVNRKENMVAMAVHKGAETKLKSDEALGQTGNALVKSLLMTYDRAAEATVTHVDAGTWQIDYAARLRGIDEDLRLQARQYAGPATFYGDGFKLVNEKGVYKVQPGVAHVGGLRAQLDDAQTVSPGAKPVGLWLDVHRAGTPLSAWVNHVTLTLSMTNLSDYVDASGYQHHVAKVATVIAGGSITDERRQRTHAHYWDELVDPPSAADLGGLPQTAYRPRTDSLTNLQGTILAIKNQDMDDCQAGDFSLYETASAKHAPPQIGSFFYCETLSIYGVEPGPALLQRAYPYAGTGVLAWRNYDRNSTQWKDWVHAYDTAHKPQPAELGAAPTVHVHTAAQVTDLKGLLDAKAPTSHTHTAAEANADIATPGTGAGQIGTYGIFVVVDPQAKPGIPGDKFAGSQLKWSSLGVDVQYSSSPAGTWKVLGPITAGTGIGTARATCLFIRVDVSADNQPGRMQAQHAGPAWADANQTTIDLQLTLPGHAAPVPFTASADDCEAHGRELFARAKAGEFGPIAPYVPPVVSEAQARAEQAHRMARLTQAMAPLQDAIELGEASDEERAQLLAMKRQRLVLHRLPASPDWPHITRWPGQGA